MSDMILKTSPFSGRKFDTSVSYPEVLPNDGSGSLYVPSVIDDIVNDVRQVSPKRKSIVFHSDVYLLFNQKRLDSLGVDSVRNYLESMYSRAGASLPEGVSDSDLFDTIRSRYIQSPSELRDYIVSLHGRQQSILDDVSRRMAAANANKDTPAASPSDSE